MRIFEAKQLKRFIISLIPALILLVAVLCTPFYSLEARLSDVLYAQLNGTNRNIKMIIVDEETLEEYGTFTNWSREKAAEVLRLLYQEEENAPLVVGLDFLFVSETEGTADQKLMEVCEKAENVVFASNLVYRGKTKQEENGTLYYDSWNVEMVEEPFDGLDTVATPGFANVHIARDGCVRYTKLTEQFAEETKESFAYVVYKKYMEALGQTPQLPLCDRQGKFTFYYSGKNGEYSHFSLKDVINGVIPVTEFKDSIVLLGAYAPGFQDSYISAIGRSMPMYGVEIHANIVQALLEGKTAVAFPIGLYLFISMSVVTLFFYIARKQKLTTILLETVALEGCHMLVGRLLAQKGYTIPQLYFLLVIFVIMIYFIIEKYFIEKFQRKKVLSTFKKYVAPQIVDKLAKEGDFNLKLGGEKRHVAVLFVDIRGFTPMSENLSPEEVVNVLNEYLALTTASILTNEGTLDKFIGDATMAVFNAPFDLEDYVYKAILTALAIRDGSETLAKVLQEKFGKTISYGIGVNMGDAVVGNIGCEFRMDYTAIGDTVNTAARLESRAKAGEILISEAVFLELQERIEAEPIGEMELKGKSKPVKVYRLISVKEK